MTTRRALTYVEVDILTCANVYGVAPCTASLGVTGAVKCFNTVATCQDSAHLNNTVPVTLRFAVPTGYLPHDIEAFPSIANVSFTPAIISLGGDLGQRATLQIDFTDHPDSDTGTGFDPYLVSRSYDPYRQGTFFGKFRARQPFLRGRPLRWINGFVGQALADMETRHFLIDSFDGPDPQGKYTLLASDVLKLADDDRAQAPELSNGFLSADITAGATTATLLPSGIGNAEYPAGGTDYLCIGGNEVVQYSRSGDTLTLVRGQLGTAAVAHKAQDRAQVVLSFVGTDAADIINTLVTGYAGVPSSYVTLADWHAETTAFLGNLYTAHLCEPTGVQTLVSELIEQAALALWDDNLAQKLRLQVLRGIVTDAYLFTVDNRAMATLAVKDQPDTRLSRVQTYFGQIDPTKPLDNLDNYRSTALAIDTAAEADYGSAAIKTITSRWIPAGGRAIADRLNAIQLGRFRDPPRHAGFEVMRNDDISVATGGGYKISAPFIQDATGAPALVPVQVTQLNPHPDRFGIEAEEMLFSAPPVVPGTDVVIFDANISNVNLQTVHDSLYPPAVAGDVVNCTVNAGVIIGSSSTALPAFDAGSWAAGVTVNISLLGRLEGCGGLGGAGDIYHLSPGLAAGSPGSPGGPAFYTRAPVNLNMSSGALWGGGGGGGGGGGNYDGAFDNGGGGGGGGGAGQSAGGAGSGGSNGPSLAPGSGGGTGSDSAGGGPGAAGAPDIGHSSAPGAGGGGGGPGLAGSSGAPGTRTGGGSVPPGGTGGAAGAAIDGISHVSLTLGGGDLRGSQIN